jgi:hypothetical protein
VLSFLQNVAERVLIRAIATAFDRYAGIDGSEDAREDAAGPIDVCAIAVAKVSSIIRCSLEMRPKNKIPKPTMPEKPATQFASSNA